MTWCCACLADLPSPKCITGDMQPAASPTTTLHLTTLILDLITHPPPRPAWTP
jgi:hypothetical protein